MFSCLLSRGFVSMCSILTKMGSSCVRQFKKNASFSSTRTLVLPSSHIQFPKGPPWMTENFFWDYFLFESSASYFLLLECAVSLYEARARSGSAWLFLPPAELHSLPHVTLSVACYSWPTYLIYFYGTFFWNNKKNVLGYLAQEKEVLSVLENGRALWPWYHRGDTADKSGASGLCPQLWSSLSLERVAE